MKTALTDGTLKCFFLHLKLIARVENCLDKLRLQKISFLTEQEKLVTDLDLTESKSANTDKDIEMSDPEKSPKRDVLEDVDMSNDDNEEEEMEANPNLNQSRILDHFPCRN